MPDLTRPTGPGGPRPQSTDLPLPAPEVLTAGQDALADASTEAALTRYTPEQRAQLGVTTTLSQIRRSFEILQLLAIAPELLPFLDRARQERWEQIVGTRLYGAQLRRALGPVQAALSGTEILARGEMTRDCDLIEDLYTAIWRDPKTPPEVKLRLEAKLDDPLRLRQLFLETQQERAVRRQRRAELGAQAQAEAAQMKAQVLEREKLRRLGEPAR